jgi:hypothetical protein
MIETYAYKVAGTDTVWVTRGDEYFIGDTIKY